MFWWEEWGLSRVKIALVHDWLTGLRGGEKCLEVLCRRFPQAKLLTLLHRKGSTSPAIERMDIVTSPLGKLPGVAHYYRYCLPLMPWAVEQLEVPADVDAVVSFSHAVAGRVRVPPGVPHVCYCFTPMRYAWHRREDYLRNEAARSVRQKVWQATGGKCTRWVQDAMLNRLRDWDRETSERVTHFVAVSRTVADRIMDCYGRQAQVIYPPVNTDFYTTESVSREDFYLVVSALVPYKRLDLAVSACNRLGKRLLVMGEGPQRSQLETLAGPTVQVVGWRSDDEIRHAMRRCRALLFPGHEDFGIVPVEAQACGAPVIALAAGGVTESILAADESRLGTGIFFEEPTVDALCAAMLELEAHPAWFSPLLCRSAALRFQASRFEREMLALLHSLASRQHRLLAA